MILPLYSELKGGDGINLLCSSMQVKETMEDGSFLAFCHFLADLFSAISKYSLLLQRNEVILPQVGFN